MKFDSRVIDPMTRRSDCLVVGVYENEKLSTAAALVDEASAGALRRHLCASPVTGKPGQTLLLHALPGVSSERVLLTGLGPGPAATHTAFQRGLSRAMEAAQASGAASATVCLTAEDVVDHDMHWRFRCAVDATRSAAYRFDQMKSKPDQSVKGLRAVTLAVPENAEASTAKRALAEGVAIANGTDLARDLGNLPGNICTPSHLAEEARKLSRRFPKIRTRVLAEAEMRRLGMGSLLSVTRGSDEPPCFIVMEFRGASPRAANTVLVGKGVTFDTGGISIKPAAAMDEMKFDMCGAACVMGTVLAAAELDLELNLVALIPATENMPGGKASKPGDIYTSMSGQTVEVLNTDAEGRLILCDALTYAGRYKPAVVVDVATLTGACVVALGAHASGLFANDDALAQDLLEAGNYTGDRAWRMPLWEDYQEALSSNFADFANVGGREGGAITAACFLARFARDYKWAHLDIAGTAWRSGKNKGSTGRPVMLLCQFLLGQVAAKIATRRRR